MLKRIIPSRFHHVIFKPELLNRAKLDLIDQCEFQSFADLGGVWRVEGGYTFHALKRRGVERGILIDTHPTDIVIKKARQFPKLQLIQGNFGDPEIAKQVDVDAVFLFDVLLHQVRPDWDEIIQMYAPRTRRFVVFNQQYTQGRTVRLVELGREQYFKVVPYLPVNELYTTLFDRLDDIHPVHNRKWRDVHHIWQWGITDQDLKRAFEELGYQQTHYKNHGPIGDSEYFENHSFIFERQS